MRTSKLFLATTLAAAAIMAPSCRPAQYEIIRDKNGKSTNKPVKPFAETDTPSTSDGTADGSDADRNPSDKPNGQTGERPVKGNVPPTARVEVMWKGESVTSVRVNEPVSVRPSLDTVDPDDIGVSSCVNPGIVKAEYELGSNGDKRSAERAQGCEPLSVPYTFSSPGEYLVSMLVTSNDNETAWATMTLLVYDGATPPAADGGFTVRAHPMLAGVGQVVTFWGTCTLGKTQVITWQFGDGGHAEGRVVTHAYQATGQYPVDATCTDETGRKESAKLTIVVIDQTGVKIPGAPEPVIPDPNDPGTNPSNPGSPDTPPTQGPGQGQPGQGEPIQGQPGQKPIQY